MLFLRLRIGFNHGLQVEREMNNSSESLLDDVGWQLLMALQENARVSYSELGRQVGMSPPAVAERVKRMEDAGIITGYRTQVNLEKLGYSIIAFIRFNAGQNCARMGDITAGIPEILECHRVTGDDSCVMKIAVSSVAHLEKVIDSLTPYGLSTTSIVLSSFFDGRVVMRNA
jgi:Lrp/AsnC family leucine-responsive transcriptional regulator